MNVDVRVVYAPASGRTPAGSRQSYRRQAGEAASPAEKAGLLKGDIKGDIISGLDDKPATAFTLGQLRDTFGRTGETHDVKVLRAGKRTSIAVAVAVVSIDQRSL
jgi:S1-C subfamily serine protease